MTGSPAEVFSLLRCPAPSGHTGAINHLSPSHTMDACGRSQHTVFCVLSSLPGHPGAEGRIRRSHHGARKGTATNNSPSSEDDSSSCCVSNPSVSLQELLFPFTLVILTKEYPCLPLSLCSLPLHSYQSVLTRSLQTLGFGTGE